MKWKIFRDGWFEYYYCSACGHKQQLTICKDKLPSKCPKCKKKRKK